MDQAQLLKKCMEALQGTQDPENHHLIKEIQKSLEVKAKDRVVIKMDGGIVNEVIANRPTKILKIEEAGDLDEEDLLEMYPEGSGMYSGDTHVYAIVKNAHCNPEVIEDEFQRYEKALENQQDVSPRPGM